MTQNAPAIGVDGCPGGWICATLTDDPAQLRLVYVETLAEVLARWPDSTIAIDMPIGLTEGGPRACDREARAVLGPRRASVFPAPDRRLLALTTYPEVRQQAAVLGTACPSKQTFYLMPKIREADQLLQPEFQRRVFESHPEVCFWWANGGEPMRAHKSTREGYGERRAVLRRVLPGCRIPLRGNARRLARPARADDVLDAAVLAWTAQRRARGLARRYPASPETDSRGLRMEIGY